MCCNIMQDHLKLDTIPNSYESSQAKYVIIVIRFQNLWRNF